MTSTASRSKLKASSPPFYPKSVEPIMGSDGMPQLVLDSHAVIHGMSDEVIFDDSIFPATIEDVNELEAVEQWVQILSFLEYMEEKEELNRNSFRDFGKRFEARRRDGSPKSLRAKAAHHLLRHNSSNAVALKHDGRKTTVKDLVRFDSSSVKMRKREQRLKNKKFNRVSSVKNQPARWTGHSKIRPIQQPSKVH